MLFSVKKFCSPCHNGLRWIMMGNTAIRLQTSVYGHMCVYTDKNKCPFGEVKVEKLYSLTTVSVPFLEKTYYVG